MAVATFTEDEAKELKRKLEADKVDYVRLVSSDLEGRALSLTVPTRHIKSGNYLHNIAIANFIHCGHAISPSLAGFPGLGNLDYCPVPGSCKLLPHASSVSNRVAQIYGCLRTERGTIDPRDVCKRVVQSLSDQLGAEVLSAVEHEFHVFQTEGGKKAWNATRYCDSTLFAEFQPFAFECEKALYRMGIDIEQMSTEWSPAQMEWTTRPVKGIEGADAVFDFRHVVREIAQKHGLRVSFATAPDFDFPVASGAHLNLSLWGKRHKATSATEATTDGSFDAKTEMLSDEQLTDAEGNLLFDASAKNCLSQFGRHFIAGILKHSAAISAFANPLDNCYRRIRTHAWAPGNVSWGFDNRSALVRVKSGSEEATYIEFRMPGPASNPYLVMAATIAAGLDGVRNKLPLAHECSVDAMSDKSAALLPQSLAEALRALEGDKVLIAAMDSEFCAAYIGVKRFQLAETKKRIEDGMDAAKAEKLHILHV